MPAEGLSSLGSPSGGVCGAAASLALALLAAARGAARQRLGVSAGDARLGVAVGAWPGEEGIDVQGANALPLLSASAAAEGAVCPGSGSPGGGGGSPGGGGGDVQGMHIHASNSLSCPPTAGSVGGVFGSGGSAGDGVCTLGGQASARGCAARPACASGSTTFISPGIPSDLRSEASGRLNAGDLTPRCTKKGKIAAACAIASGGFVLKRNLGTVAPEAAGAREAASS